MPVSTRSSVQPCRSREESNSSRVSRRYASCTESTRTASLLVTRSLEREKAFVRTAANAGVVVEGARKISTRLDSAGGRAAAKSLLRSPRPPRAVVCGSDEIAIGVMEYALSIGLRIPEDLAVVGSDGLPHSRSALISLTSVVQPMNEMAERSFELLLDQIIHPRFTYQHVICKHRIHIGRTCGCLPVRQDSTTLD